MPKKKLSAAEIIKLAEESGATTKDDFESDLEEGGADILESELDRHLRSIEELPTPKRQGLVDRTVDSAGDLIGIERPSAEKGADKLPAPLEGESELDRHLRSIEDLPKPGAAIASDSGRSPASEQLTPEEKARGRELLAKEELTDQDNEFLEGLNSRGLLKKGAFDKAEEEEEDEEFRMFPKFEEGAEAEALGELVGGAVDVLDRASLGRFVRSGIDEAGKSFTHSREVDKQGVVSSLAEAGVKGLYTGFKETLPGFLGGADIGSPSVSGREAAESVGFSTEPMDIDITVTGEGGSVPEEVPLSALPPQLQGDPSLVTTTETAKGPSPAGVVGTLLEVFGDFSGVRKAVKLGGRAYIETIKNVKKVVDNDVVKEILDGTSALKDVVTGTLKVPAIRIPEIATTAKKFVEGVPGQVRKSFRTRFNPRADVANKIADKHGIKGVDNHVEFVEGDRIPLKERTDLEASGSVDDIETYNTPMVETDKVIRKELDNLGKPKTPEELAKELDEAIDTGLDNRLKQVGSTIETKIREVPGYKFDEKTKRNFVQKFRAARKKSRTQAVAGATKKQINEAGGFDAVLEFKSERGDLKKLFNQPLQMLKFIRNLGKKGWGKGGLDIDILPDLSAEQARDLYKAMMSIMKSDLKLKFGAATIKDIEASNKIFFEVLGKGAEAKKILSGRSGKALLNNLLNMEPGKLTNLLQFVDGPKLKKLRRGILEHVLGKEVVVSGTKLSFVNAEKLNQALNNNQNLRLLMGDPNDYTSLLELSDLQKSLPAPIRVPTKAATTKKAFFGAIEAAFDKSILDAGKVRARINRSAAKLTKEFPTLTKREIKARLTKARNQGKTAEETMKSLESLAKGKATGKKIRTGVKRAAPAARLIQRGLESLGQ